MKYRSILGSAWKNTWHNKYLWFFGLFAALLGGTNELSFVYRGFNSNLEHGMFYNFKRWAETGIFSKAGLVNLSKLIAEDPITLFISIFLLVVMGCMFLFLLWLAIVSQTAIVNNAARYKSGKDHDFKEGLDVGIKNFWPVFGINVIMKIVICLLAAFLSMPIIMSGLKSYFSFGNVLFLILFLLFIPFVICFSLIMKYAIVFIVLKGETLGSSIKKAWQLFCNNWLISLEMAVILFFISFFVSLCLLVIFVVLTVPFLFLIMLVAKMSIEINLWFIIFFVFLLFIAIMALVGALLTTFQVSSWTILFMDLIGKGGKSKLTRIFDN